MLALAAITYRGFAKHDEAEIAELIHPWVAKLSA
jgi:hypothetical protein